MLTLGEKELSWKALLPQLLLLALTLTVGVWDHRIMLVTFAFNLLTMVVGRNLYVICQLFFLLPFTMIYKSSPTSSSYFSFALFAFALLLVLKSRVNVAKIIVVALYLLLGLTNKFDIWLKHLSEWILLLYFVRNVNRDDFKYVAVSLSLGLIVSSIIGLYKSSLRLLSIYFSSMNDEYVDGERISRFSALYLDPNYFSIITVCTIFMLLTLTIARDIKAKYSVPMLLSLIYFGSLTYSRVFLLAIILVLVTQLWDVIWYSKYRLLTLVAIAFALIIFLPWLASTDMYGLYSGRMQAEDVSNGRLDIWSSYIHHILETPSVFILGVGMGGKLFNHVGAHNTFIEAWYHLGILGTTVYLSTLISIFRSRRLLSIKTYKNYVLIVVFCIMISTLGMLVMNDIYIEFMMIWCSMNINYKLINKDGSLGIAV